MNKGPLESEERRRKALFPFYCYRIPAGASVPCHWHPELEIVYAAGNGTINIDGKEFPFELGDILFVPSGALHYSNRCSNGEVYHIVVDPTLLKSGDSNSNSNQVVEKLIQGKLQIQFVVDRGSVLYMELLPIVQNFVKYSETEISSCEVQFVIKSGLYAIMAVLFRANALQCIQDDPGDDASLAEQLMRFVKERYHMNITIDDLARHVHCSKTAVYRVFRNRIGMTPVNYINAIRIQQACRLLQAGERVSETAEAIGIANVTYFVKLFKRHIGKSPHQWAKECRNR